MEPKEIATSLYLLPQKIRFYGRQRSVQHCTSKDGGGGVFFFFFLCFFFLVSLPPDVVFSYRVHSRAFNMWDLFHAIAAREKTSLFAKELNLKSNLFWFSCFVFP